MSLWTSTRFIPEFRTRAMEPVCVGEEEDGFFKLGDFVIHLVLLDVRFGMRQVVDGTLAMGSCDNVSRILAYILCNFSPKAYAVVT
jgi:hypothetical protein